MGRVRDLGAPWNLGGWIRFHQAIAVDPALYFPQQDNLNLSNIFLLVKTSVQFLLKGVRYRHGNHRTVGLWKCYAKKSKTNNTHMHTYTHVHTHTMSGKWTGMLRLGVGRGSGGGGLGRSSNKEIKWESGHAGEQKERTASRVSTSLLPWARFSSFLLS